jgi:hypothetical protein
MTIAKIDYCVKHIDNQTKAQQTLQHSKVDFDQFYYQID